MLCPNFQDSQLAFVAEQAGLSLAKQAGLSLIWSQIPEDRFSRYLAQKIPVHQCVTPEIGPRLLL